jgi:SAM-dependent methyltransferase
MIPQFPPEFFRRIDESDDELFYLVPRFVVHIDEAAIRALGQIYLSRLPASGAILDLMGSWRSHLASGPNYERVVGLGLNRSEMEDNPVLTEVVVHNLNRAQRLPFPDAVFDGATLAVSVQYIVHPVEIFSDVGRVLKPGAPFIVAFSNRMFSTKAVAIWMSLGDKERVTLVREYFTRSAAFERIENIDRSGNGETDPLWVVIGYRKDSPRG